jgi:hypothetical protein
MGKGYLMVTQGRRNSRLMASVLLPVAALAILAPHPATAQGYSKSVCAQGKGGISLAVEGAVIVLRGGICPKDDAKFGAFLKTVDPSVRTVKLASSGGNGPAAQAIGAAIRAGHFDTWVDGAVDGCASACTHIFASGNRRFYSGASTITTGTAVRRGLGYHYPDARHEGESDLDKDRKFNTATVPFLNRMLPVAGARAVAALMRANRTAQMTWLNGEEALRDEIATALTAPR